MAKLGQTLNSLMISMVEAIQWSHPKQMRYQAAPRADISTNYLKSHSNSSVKHIQFYPINSANKCSKMHAFAWGYCGKTWTFLNFIFPILLTLAISPMHSPTRIHWRLWSGVLGVGVQSAGGSMADVFIEKRLPVG